MQHIGGRGGRREEREIEIEIEIERDREREREKYLVEQTQEFWGGIEEFLGGIQGYQQSCPDEIRYRQSERQHGQLVSRSQSHVLCQISRAGLEVSKVGVTR